jgi:tRNA-splicing ligase RtcB
MNVLEKNFQHETEENILSLLKQLVEKPEDFYENVLWGKVAERIKPHVAPEKKPLKLLDKGIDFNVFGADYIENGAWTQMKIASKLPVAVAGALMPDAHTGYGLPIGGVLATDNAVIPYGVGVDIGCRMCLSVLQIEATSFDKYAASFEDVLVTNTVFGTGGEWTKNREHPLIESPLFKELKVLQGMERRALKQLGTSGSGNHFAEFGILDLPLDDADLGLKNGKYVAFLTHSGSRGIGATIAKYYTNIAMKKRYLPKEAHHLAWFSLDEQEGVEYWLAMNLAGDYASACHHLIHQRIAKALGVNVIARVENHHNFAWKELFEGKEVIVHRKGATPAKLGEMGIIPGSMTAPGFVVRGKGESASLQSASHGAGRLMSRSQSKKTITQYALKNLLKQHEVTLIGGGLDEAPHAYKDIHLVMQAQNQLVDKVATFFPRIVRMAGEKGED